VAADRHVRQRPFPRPWIAPSADVEQPQIAPLRTVGEEARAIDISNCGIRTSARHKEQNISHWFRDEMINWPALLSTNDFNLLHCLEARSQETWHQSSFFMPHSRMRDRWNVTIDIARFLARRGKVETSRAYSSRLLLEAGHEKSAVVIVATLDFYMIDQTRKIRGPPITCGGGSG
jgi:hypothetical protein